MIRVPFLGRKDKIPGRRVHRLPRSVRAPVDNPYFNKRVQRRFARVLPIIGVASALTLLIVGSVLAVSLPQVRISRVSVEGHDRVSRADIETAITAEYGERFLGVFPRRNYFLLRTEAIQRALQDNADIASADVSKEFPDRLRILVRERETAYNVVTDDARVFADESGVAFQIFPGEGGGRAFVATTTPPLGASSTPVRIMTTTTHPLPFLLGQIRSRATTSYPTLYDTSPQTAVVGEVIVPERIRAAYMTLEGALEALRMDLRPIGAIYDRSRQHELVAVSSEGWYVLLDPGFDLGPPLSALAGLLSDKLRTRDGLQYIDVRYPDRIYYK